MTHCREQLAFSFRHCTGFVADFKGGLISSDAGLLPPRELDDRLGRTAAIAACLGDPRDPAKIAHDLLTLLRQRLFALIAGYEDTNDHTRLRDDPILKAVAHRTLDQDLASQPTLSRFENAVTAREVIAMSRLLVHFKQGRGPRKVMEEGEEPRLAVSAVPRISRLMSLAIRMQELVDRGEVADYAELARLAHVSRPRITQIMNLTLLAPDIQEAILFLPATAGGRASIREWLVRPIDAVPD